MIRAATLSRPAAVAIAAALAFGHWAPPALGASPPPVEGKAGMVVTAQHLASEVGAAILSEGGNAVDAAVAIGYALAVVHPCCGNLGGGGFMTVHLAEGGDHFVDFRETAPAAASETMYLDAKGEVVPRRSLDGYLAVGVPGSVLGLETARERFGTMARRALIEPAIRLAEAGFVLDRGDTDLLQAKTQAFQTQPNVAAIFLKDGKAYQPGDRLVQSDLARSLRLIADSGPHAFYGGPIADAIVAASRSGGGILAMADFAAYRVGVGEPISCSYRGYRLITAPPPSSGGTTLCLILNILEGYDLAQSGFHSAAEVHLMVEAMRHAFLDRNTYLGDPAFVRNPLERLLSKDYAQAIRRRIDPDQATPSAELAPGTPPHEGSNTTHYSVVDRAGNAVAVTYTINAGFGAGVIAGDTGFFLNDEMDDFTSKPGVPNLFGLVQGKANAIQPGKRPLSSMTPTVITKDGRLAMVTGSPGGSRIITITLETILNVIDHGMTIQEAVDAPRIHHQWLPDEIAIEPRAFTLDTQRLLTAMGYKIAQQRPWGSAESILAGTDRLYGANDSRSPAGRALGVEAAQR
jgi:gamma-glutamyltranspeptidase/glutathione hydrolase